MGAAAGWAARRRRGVDALTVGGFRLAWKVLCRVPEPVAYRLFEAIADVTHLRGGTGVQRLRSNYARVRPELDALALDALVREGLRSYLRYWCDAFRLANRSPEAIVAGVRVVGDGPVRQVLEQGRAVVCFLGHMGNWDSAGAWATLELAPVLTVAERLRPEELYGQFQAFREKLGMTILPLSGQGDVFGRLVRRAARGGIIVPLLADRDLSHTGVEVDFVGRRARMAPGPAALALAVGAALHPVSIRYEPWPGGPGGHRIVITFHEAVPIPPPGASRERVAAMTQGCADALAGAVRAHTQDWHMMQAIFVEDLDPHRSAAPAAAAPTRE